MRWFALLLLVGCGGKAETAEAVVGTPGATPTGSASGTPTGTVSTTGTLPADPRPLSIDFNGAFTGTIEFDTATCSHYPFPSLVNFRMFWRGSGHNAVLIAEVLSDFDGAGTYATGTDNLRVKLQTEAGTVYNFDPFNVDLAAGDSATMTVDHIGNIAYGQFDFSGMSGPSGAITASPSTVPIWCEAVEN